MAAVREFEKRSEPGGFSQRTRNARVERRLTWIPADLSALTNHDGMKTHSRG